MSEDIVNNPSHYVVDGLECFDAIFKTQGRVAAMDFCSCNMFKYIFRHRRKNGIQDMRKVKKYVDMFLELAEGCTDEELEQYFYISRDKQSL